MNETEMVKYGTNNSRFDILDNLDGTRTVHKISVYAITDWNAQIAPFLGYLQANPHPNLLTPEGSNGSPGQHLHEFYALKSSETLDDIKASLQDDMRRGAIKGDHLIDMMAQLTKAVAHIHRQGLIHSDIKPTNIFVELDDKGVIVTLFDYNSVKRPYLQVHPIDSWHPEHPPELAEGHFWVDSRFDMYAIGEIFHELTHTYSFDTLGYTRIETLDPNHPLFDVISKCMAEPAQRYNDADELLSDLQSTP